MSKIKGTLKVSQLAKSGSGEYKTNEYIFSDQLPVSKAQSERVKQRNRDRKRALKNG